MKSPSTLLIELEEVTLARAIEYARIILRKLVEQIDALIRRYRPRELKVIHKRSVWYHTRLGMIRISRRQYQDAEIKLGTASTCTILAVLFVMPWEMTRKH